MLSDMLNGYEPKTTFWQDFTIADAFGIDAIQETYNKAFEEWKDNYIYLTELVMVLNHKAWQHFENGKAGIYTTLYYKTDTYALDHLKGDELSYYISTLD
jgi:hypothetical protein